MNRRKSSRRRIFPPLFVLGVLGLNVLVVALLYRWQSMTTSPRVMLPGRGEHATSRAVEPSADRERARASAQTVAPPSPKQEKTLLVVKAGPAAGPVDVRENFDKTARGLPLGWLTWTNRPENAFGVSDQKALSPPHALAISGDSKLSARAWIERPLPADINARAAVFLGSLIPGQVLIRGTGLTSSQPTYYAATIARGLEVQLVRVVRGEATVLGKIKSAGYISAKWARVSLQAQGKRLRVRAFRCDTSQYLDADGQWVADPAWAIDREDTAIAEGGAVGLGRVGQYSGALFFDDFEAVPPRDDAVTGQGARAGAAIVKAPPVARPEIPRHYPHIRVAMLAYYGNPMGAFEDALLQSSVDLVVPNVAYLEHIHSVAPKTPQLIYANTSNLYLELFMSWLTFADARKISREEAFYHAARPVPFRGSSPSSRPVSAFWGVYRGGASLDNLTPDALGGRQLAFPRFGESLYLGYPERFGEINVEVASEPEAGWSAVLEYPSEVDDAGVPMKWKPIKVKSDSTASLAKSGRIAFDPPADWRTVSLQNTVRLHYVRWRASETGSPPTVSSLRGRDYVNARGGTAGVVPAFDFKADLNGDGYLDDEEYRRRAKGKDARFAYESRLLTESYGQMRFSSRPSSARFREWAVEYHRALIKQHPFAGGFFMDNSDGKAPVNASDAAEGIGTYAQDYGLMLNSIARAIAPRWALANTALHVRADPVVRLNPAYMEEFAIRPLAHHYIYFEDLAATIARRAKLTSPPPLAIIDSHAQGGDLADPRMQLATLAYYYLISDADSTFLMLYGGFEPASTWKRHWLAAIHRDVGRPTEKWRQWKDGADPHNPRLSYRVYRRDFEKAIVLFKPLSYTRGVSDVASSGDDTRTEHDLEGAFRPMAADGTLGGPVTRVLLRNGEGAILFRK